MVQAAVLDEYNEAGVTLEGDIETGEVVIPEVPAAAVDHAVAKAQERVAEIKARPAAEIPPPAPKPEKVVTEPAIYNVKGKLVRYTEKTSTRGAPFLVLTVSGHTKGIFVYKADWHDHLKQAKGKMIDIQAKIDGSYNHLHAINKLGDQEFHDGVPVIQRGEVIPTIAPIPEQGDFNPTDEDIPF
jgi:hypothetical protein